MISDKRILVTGGGGFIGSHLVEKLAAENRVTVLDDFSTGSRSNIDAIPSDRVYSGSITDPDVVHDAVEGQDVVVHMAALMGVRRTLERPLDVLEVNVEGTRTLLRNAAREGVERVILASTSEVYGDSPEPPYHEDDETAPKTNYAVAKLTDERFVEAYGETHGLDYTILRYFNVYGPRQDSSSYGYVVPMFVRRALAGDTLQVHGDGEQTRDFTYIDDAVRATVRSLGPEGRNEIFNVGGGSEVEIRRLAEIVVDVVGSGTIEHVDHPRPYRVARRCADTSKARERLGYSPQVSLEEGIEKMANEIGALGGGRQAIR